MGGRLDLDQATAMMEALQEIKSPRTNEMGIVYDSGLFVDWIPNEAGNTASSTGSDGEK